MTVSLIVNQLAHRLRRLSGLTQAEGDWFEMTERDATETHPLSGSGRGSGTTRRCARSYCRCWSQKSMFVEI